MKREKVIIELEVDVADDGEEDAAAYVVGEVLDDGDFQDTINNHCFDAADMTVVSAVVKRG